MSEIERVNCSMVLEWYILSNYFITNITRRVGDDELYIEICSPYRQSCNIVNLSEI